jgi:hypothetical protein
MEAYSNWKEGAQKDNEKGQCIPGKKKKTNQEGPQGTPQKNKAEWDICGLVLLGHLTGIPRVGFCHTVPVAGRGTHRTIIFAV